MLCVLNGIIIEELVGCIEYLCISFEKNPNKNIEFKSVAIVIGLYNIAVRKYVDFRIHIAFISVSHLSAF